MPMPRLLRFAVTAIELDAAAEKRLFAFVPSCIVVQRIERRHLRYAVRGGRKEAQDEISVEESDWRGGGCRAC